MSAERPATGLGTRPVGAARRSGAAGAGRRGERASRGGVREIEIARIRPNPDQPRMQFDEEALDELADSIAERGVLQPILLRPDGDGFPDHRRRAALARGAAGAAAHHPGDRPRDRRRRRRPKIALIENIQREDLNAIEEAEGYRQLIERHGHTQDESASSSTSRAATSPTC